MNVTHDLSILALVMNASVVVKIVMAILVLASLVSWTYIFMKIFALRQARRATYPDPLHAALQAEQSGADSITLHLREDRRHIQDHDVERMATALQTRMNLEMAATSEMVAIARRIRPADVCLVPEKRTEVTTEGGLDVVTHRDRVRACVEALRAAATATGSRTEDVAENVAEDIAEVGAAAASTEATCALTVHARMAELVIGGTLLRIGENLVGLVGFLESCKCSFDNFYLFAGHGFIQLLFRGFQVVVEATQDLQILFLRFLFI